MNPITPHLATGLPLASLLTECERMVRVIVPPITGWRRSARTRFTQVSRRLVLKQLHGDLIALRHVHPYMYTCRSLQAMFGRSAMRSDVRVRRRDSAG